MDAPPSPRKFPPLLGTLAPWAILALCLLLTGYGWHLIRQYKISKAEHLFATEVLEQKTAILHRMVNYENALRSGVALMNSSPAIGREQWRTFVASLKLQEYFPGIQGMGWSAFITPEALIDHTRFVREQGFPAYRMWPDGPRQIYTAILYLEPFNRRNLRAFGYDMFSEATRHAAMAHARDSGQATLSGKVTLVQEGEGEIQAGCLLYIPVYRPGLALDTPEERRQGIVGFVYASFRMNDLMEGIMGNKFPLIALRIYDGPDPTPKTLMYDSHRQEPAQTVQADFQQVETVDMAHNPWTIEFSSTREFVANLDQELPRLVLMAGILTSLLAFALVQTLALARNRAVHLAQKMTLELSASEERSRTIFNVAVTGMVVIDHHGIIQNFNPAAEQVFGYQAAEVAGRNVNCLMPEPYHTAHDGYLQSYLQTGQARIIGIGREVVGKRKNGETFPMMLSVGQALIAGKRLFVGSVMDITQRKQAEKEIQEHLHLVHLRAAIGAILIQNGPLNDMLHACAATLVEKLAVVFARIWLFDSAEQVLHLKASAGLYTHLNGEHGRIPLGSFKIGQIAATRTPHFTNTVIGDPRIPHQEWARREGLVAFAGYPLVVEEQLVGVVGMFARHPFSDNIFHALTAIANELALGVQNKQTEEALVAAKEVAEAANRSKSEFLNMMSHELRTPLTVILGYMPLLTDPGHKLPAAKKLVALLADQDQPQAELGQLLGKISMMAGEVKRNGEHLLTLINDLLDISKIEADKMTLSRQSLSTTAVVAGVVQALQIKAAEKGLRLTLRGDDATVFADEIRLKQILLNLVGNAIKFTERGEICVSTQSVNRAVAFSVADSGVGIPLQDLDKVFERFHQVDSSSTRSAGGTGLGLAITKRLVVLHGGTIGVTSTPGQGSVFRFTIPHQEG